MTFNFAKAEDFVLNAKGIPYSNEEKEDSYLLDMDLKFSNPNNVCQSTKCLIEIPESNSVWFSAPTGTENHVTIYGKFFIRDDANNNLTPLKRDLVETWNVYGQNYVSDIDENIDNNEIIYYFNGTLSFNNDFKKLEEEYEMKGFYKLPERILQINGTR